MQAAIEEVQSQLGQEYSLVIGGKAYDTQRDDRIDQSIEQKTTYRTRSFGAG